MEIKKITDPSFKKYGKIINNIDLTDLYAALEAHTPSPEDVIYEPSVSALESTKAFSDLQAKAFGELPIQIGFCNGKNHLLNAFEYHRSSEINAAATDAILILGMQQDITSDFTYDTSLAEAFLLPKGTAVELYATTLHYAPASVGDAGFKVGIVLPKDTNLPLEKDHCGGEDKLITARNKWLIGHPEGGHPEGVHLGLIGENLSV